MATEEHERIQMHVGQAWVGAEGQQRREQVLLSLPSPAMGSDGWAFPLQEEEGGRQIPLVLCCSPLQPEQGRGRQEEPPSSCPFKGGGECVTSTVVKGPSSPPHRPEEGLLLRQLPLEALACGTVA